MANNSTGLSLAGIIKWLLIIISFPFFIKAWQGIVGHVTTDDSGNGHSTGALVTGSEAIHFGGLNLLYAVLCLIGAGAVWYFWQQNED